MSEENSKSPNVVFFEKFVNGSLQSLSTWMDGLLVGGNCWSSPMTIDSHEENVLNYSMFYDRYSTKGIEFRTLGRPIYVRQHAVSRFMQRAVSPFRSVVRSLWPGLLLIEGLEHFSGQKIAQAFMLPTSHGVFLGVRALGKPPADIREGLERCAISAASAREDTDKSSDGSLISLWTIDTFVSLDDMKSDQIELHSRLETIIDEHYNVLMVAHLGRVMNFKDEVDVFGLEKRYFGSVEATKGAFEALLASDLWLLAIRDPKNGIFSKHFVAQAMLEREDKKSSH